MLRRAFNETDIEGKLPAPARVRLDKLRARADELHAALLRASDERNEYAREKLDAERRLHELTDKVAAMGKGNMPVDADHPAAKQAIARRDRAAAQLEQANDRYEARSARWHDAKGLVSGIERWLSALPPDAKIKSYAGPPPKSAKGETAFAAIERVRRTRTELEAAVHKVRSAPVLSSTAKARIKSEVDALAQAGRPDVWPAVENRESVRWPTRSINARVMGVAVTQGAPTNLDGHAIAELPNTLALMLWLFKDHVIAALNREVDQISDDKAALSDEERALQENALLESILDAERAEEALIQIAEAEGMEVGRRRDADPSAVLNITVRD
jgi:hypothetical protein